MGDCTKPWQVASAAVALAALTPSEAWAKGGQWGPLEGKASSHSPAFHTTRLCLVHPIVMSTFFFTMLYTGFLGWQWRQTRTLGADLSSLRKQLPKAGAPPWQWWEPDEDPEHESAATKSLKQQISQLDAERKELVKEGYKDKHHTLSSIILGGSLATPVENMHTFRAEKLFPGPHLFAGAAIVVIWAVSAALVPFMEKGGGAGTVLRLRNDSARTAHIALNGVNVLLFAWQLPTGFEIAQKVWGLDIPWV
eukprot:Skav202071  [mRNA]  locus=scaffold1138:742174:746431:- [translate_table: standard]